MKSFDDGMAPGETDRNPIDPEELERSLTPPDDTVISPDLLDELFEAEDPRVQSGVNDDDSDDDLDFIRMSGLTSPAVSDDINAIDALPKIDKGLTPPVSFYEPGVADVDASMAPNPDELISAGDSVVSDSERAEAELAAQETEARDAIERDSVSDDEVFSDLVSPGTVDADLEASAQSSPAGEVEPVLYPASVEMSANETDDDQTLAAPEENIGDDASLDDPMDDSIFDEMLVNLEDGPAADEAPTLEEFIAVEPTPETAVEPDDNLAADEPVDALAAEEPEVPPTTVSEVDSFVDEPATEELPASEIDAVAAKDAEDGSTIDNVVETSTETDRVVEALAAEEPVPEMAVEPESSSEVDDAVIEEFSADESEVDISAVADVVERLAEAERAVDELAAEEPEVPTIVVSEDAAFLDEPVVDEITAIEPEAQAVVDLDDDLSVEDVIEEIVSSDPDEAAVIEPEEPAVVTGFGPAIDESVVEGFVEAEPEATVVPDEGLIPDEPTVEKLVAAEPVSVAAAAPESEDPYEGQSTVQRFGRRSSRHHRRHEQSYPRLLKAAAVILIIGGVLAYGGYEGFRWFRIQVANPTTLYYEAESTAANIHHLQASRLYEEFVRRYSEHPLAADAMFAAGYQMQQVETDDAQLALQYSEESIALLGEFARRYPNHDRAGRAQSLIGIIHYRKGDYRAAVDAFIDRDAILRDPAATLPMLRTLARSYAKLGEYEAAHSAFTRAANAPGNPSPDTDYDELGEMYQALAESADTTDQHTAYQELALEHWSHAIRYPGINPTRKNAIRVKVGLLGELSALNRTSAALVSREETSSLVVPLNREARISQAAFELTTPLPFGPIVKGLPGNDDPESASEPAVVPPADDGPVTTEFQVVPDESPSEIEDDVTLSTPILEPVEEAQPVRHHEVTSGEQLYRIALRNGVSIVDLMRWNHIADANRIKVGQRLVLDGPVPEDE